MSDLESETVKLTSNTRKKSNVTSSKTTRKTVKSSRKQSASALASAVDASHLTSAVDASHLTSAVDASHSASHSATAVDASQLASADASHLTSADVSLNSDFVTHVLSHLPPDIKPWVQSLTAKDYAKILEVVYNIPEFTSTLSICNNDLKNKVIKGSAEIGKSGEQLFAEICQTLPAEYSLLDTAKQAHKGDYIIEYNSDGVYKKCLVDIKKYTSTIPKKELDKFHSDLAEDQYDCGLLISLNSKIVGYSKAITIVPHPTTHGNIDILYLSNVSDPYLIKQAIQILVTNNIVEQKNKGSLDKINNAIKIINISIGNSNAARSSLRELEKSTSLHIQKCNELLLTLEMQIKQAILSIESD